MWPDGVGIILRNLSIEKPSSDSHAACLQSWKEADRTTLLNDGDFLRDMHWRRSSLPLSQLFLFNEP